MDVLEIDAASNNGVDHVRELRNEVSFVPSAVKFRVYIIDEVHMMTSSAFNALLKTLEEPPAHAIFILATTEANKVPATIQSRCQRFDFRRLSGSDIVANLEKIAKQEGFSIEKDASNLIAVLSDGAMRDAISMLESVKSASEGNITTAITREILGVPSPEKYIELVYAIAENSIGDALTLSNEIINKSGDAASFANQLLEHFRDLAVCKNLSDPSDIIERPAEVVKKLQQQAEKFTNEKIILCMQKLCELIALGKSAALTKALIESGIVLLCA
jgi:DNA polymerase-3 subunit gamma/tau